VPERQRLGHLPSDPIDGPDGGLAQRVGGSCGEDTSVTVPGQANIFGAAVDELPAAAGGGGAVPPICVVIPAGTLRP
jgi:hypothetical protein